MHLKIAIIDDNSGNRNILHAKLTSSSLFKIVLTAEDGNDFLEQMKSMPLALLPDVALMDLEMPNMDGVEAIETASILYPSVKFIVLTIFDDEDRIFKAIKAGAFGYLLKDESAENLSGMLLQMQESGVGPISPGIAHKMLQLVQRNDVTFNGFKANKSPDALLELTDREKEILTLLVQGLMYKEIGAELGISAHTAKKHVLNIYQKLHVKNRSQAMNIVHNKGHYKL
jgi:DNA-binding NarL/FixJ family response regulator